MLTPAPMIHVTISLLREDSSELALILSQFGNFSPLHKIKREKKLPDQIGKEYVSLYQSAQGRLRKILSHLELTVETPPEEEYQVLPQQELEELNEWLGEIWKECSACEENERKYHHELQEIRQLDKMLKNYQSLDIDLGLLQGDFRFLDVITGSVPVQNEARLKEALGIAGYSVSILSRKDNQTHVIIAGLKENSHSLNEVLKAASFHEFPLPEEFKDKPEKVAQDLATRSKKIATEQQHLQKERNIHKEQHGQRLLQAVHQLTAASGFAQFSNELSGKGGLAVVSGWIPKNKLALLEQMISRKLDGRVLVQHRAPKHRESNQVPSHIPHAPMLAPFKQLVLNYGVPRYGELDPTWLFAISFVIMFGMMFGDIGHGALIALSGLLARRRFTIDITPFLVASGLSSVVFGFLYGSIFGFEHLIPAIWISPLSDPILMLKVALGWGIGFILLATLITIRNRVVEKNWPVALFAANGIAGVWLYLAMLFGGYRWLQQDSFGWLESMLLLVPLLIILGYKWQQLKAPAGERLLVVMVEGFETIVGYVSNTLSFLRVAAFSINHVALAVAVFALANMMDVTGYWITVVLGNLFILVLEGAIVIIQVLRLEYFEGFSRFFSGDGLPFRPMQLSPKNVISDSVK